MMPLFRFGDCGKAKEVGGYIQALSFCENLRV